MKNKQMKSIFVIFVLALLSFERILASRNLHAFLGNWTETFSDGKINFFRSIGVNQTVLEYIKQHNPKTSINIKEIIKRYRIKMEFSAYNLEIRDIKYDIHSRGPSPDEELINGKEVGEDTNCVGNMLSSRYIFYDNEKEYIEVHRNVYEVNNSMVINYKLFSTPAVTYYAIYKRS
ncbi:uncharacterized protein [Lepeophtheirus salmonis]|uniref:uncharacterized protein n=1 Tax=Lepeophtheirus salmonis TaxID=72036 RepID=UPI001AE53AED|nr:uncharacterized protein LOC121131548 [Lepeophtheirus salmonis]